MEHKFRPVAKPTPTPVVPVKPVLPVVPIPPQPINGQPSGLTSPKKQPKRRLFWIILSIVTLIILSCIAAIIWYNIELSPVSTNEGKLTTVTVEQGSTPHEIAGLLQSKNIIRSGFVFEVYTKISGSSGKLEAGIYRLTPADSTQEIVTHLTKGDVDTFKITFKPGATLAENRQVLLNAGFSASDVDSALAKTYDSPLFASKPAGADLEGYMYGQTYNFNSGATVETILQRTFDDYNDVIVANNLVSAFQAHGLTLYQGITLASIVQREVSSLTPNVATTDQKQVAQVFYSRLAQSMPLGSDVTFIYAATKLGVTPSPDLDSPYNTRINTGLPPGPIAVPSLGALLATASPATTNYLYFLAGDDGKIYFAQTEAQHEANIANYCKQNCN